MPGAEDSVVLKLKVEMEEIEGDFKKVRARLTELKRVKGKENREERKELGLRERELKRQHKDTLTRLKEEEGQRRKANSFWLRDRVVTLDSIGKKYKSWARQNPGAAAAISGVGTAGKIIGRPAAMVARTGLGMFASGASGLLGMLIGGMQQGYQTYLSVGQAMGSITGMGATKKGMRQKIGPGLDMGFRPSETWQQAAQVGRAVGQPAAVNLAQQFALGGGGMQVGEATGIMGQLRQAGVQFNSGNRPETAVLLSKMIEKGLITGLEKARLPEYLKGVSTMAEQVGGRQTGRVDVEGIATQLAYLGRVPGLQGQRGVNVMQRLDQAIRSPGGGEAGQQLMLQSMGFGVPGGENVRYYEAVKRQQAGVGDKENVFRVLKMIQQQYGPLGSGAASEEANMVANQQLGIELKTLEALGDMINSGADQKDILKQIEEGTKKFKPIEERVVDAINEGFASVRKRLAGQEAKSAKIGADAAQLIESTQDEMYKLLKEILILLKPHMTDIIMGIKYMGEWARVSLKELGKTIKGIREVVPIGTAVSKAMGGGVPGAAAGGLAAAYIYMQRQKNQELLNKYSGIPISRIQEVEKIKEEEERVKGEMMPPGLVMGGHQVSEEWRTKQKQRLENLRKQREYLIGTKPLTPEERTEYGEQLEAMKAIEAKKAKRAGAEWKRQEKEKKKTKTKPTAEITPETGSEADPWAPGGKYAPVAQPGMAGVRMVSGTVQVPVPNPPQTTFKGAPGGGKAAT